MAEKTALPQVNYISDNPEQDWERFQDAMKHILKASKEQPVPCDYAKDRVTDSDNQARSE